MSPLLLGFLATLAAVTVLVLASLICQAVTDVRVAKHTGVDPRVDRAAAKRMERDRPLPNKNNAMHYDERGRFVGPKPPSGEGPASPPKGGA